MITVKKFWNWVKNENERTLYFDGYIAEDSWFEDEITPKQFKAELSESSDNISVWLNSPGGDVFAATQIYNMIKEYPGRVVVKIDGLAASAASVIAMAGDEIHMSPTGMLMIHNPSTAIFGEASDFQSGIAMLNEVKEGIINAYEQKTGLSRTKLAHMMDAETWMSAKKAVSLGFADKVLYESPDESEQSEGFIFDKLTVVNALKSKLPQEDTQEGTPYEQLEKRLNLLKY